MIYSLRLSEISVINYENGEILELEEQDDEEEEVEVEAEGTVVEGTPESASVVQNNTGLQSVSDAELEKMVWIESQYKKVKATRILGWIGGGALAAVGIGAVALGSSGGFKRGAGACIGFGVAGVAAGAGIVTICTINANKKKTQ